MCQKVLISSLLVIVFSYGTDSVMLNPDLAKELPQMHFSDDQIKCFNKYWDIKVGYEKEERKRWDCPKDKCEKGEECCAAYIVYDKTKDNQNIAECSQDSMALVKSGAIPKALKKIEEKCKPDFEYNSQKCKDLESKIGTKNTESSESGDGSNKAEPNQDPQNDPKIDPKKADKTEPKNGNDFQMDFNPMLALISVLLSLFFI